MKILIVTLLLLGACSKHKVDVDADSVQQIIIDLKLVEDVNLLCQEATLKDDFTDAARYQQAVAQCTLDNLKLFEFSPEVVLDFIDAVCDLTEMFPGANFNEQGEINDRCSRITI